MKNYSLEYPIAFKKHRTQTQMLHSQAGVNSTNAKLDQTDQSGYTTYLWMLSIVQVYNKSINKSGHLDLNLQCWLQHHISSEMHHQVQWSFSGLLTRDGMTQGSKRSPNVSDHVTINHSHSSTSQKKIIRWDVILKPTLSRSLRYTITYKTYVQWRTAQHPFLVGVIW